MTSDRRHHLVIATTTKPQVHAPVDRASRANASKSERIIHRFESIEIDEDTSDLALIALGGLERLRQPVDQQIAIR